MSVARGDGWRLPTDDVWRQMAKHYGGVGNDSPDKGKAPYTALLSGGTSGFNAVLGGNRSIDGQYDRLEAQGFYWTVSENDPNTHRSITSAKAVKRSIVSPKARSRWQFPCVASGSDRSKFGPAKSNRSGTHSTVRSQLLLPSRAVWSDSCGEASAWRNPTTPSHSLASADRRTYHHRSTIGFAIDSTTRMPAGRVATAKRCEVPGPTDSK
jgi:hypothetical protein